jgi:transglutaminase-like putative cysteine protease
VASRLLLYAAALVTGAAFGIIFTGKTLEGAPDPAALPGGASVVMIGAALVAMLVGSAGRWRFVLVFPAAALYVLLAVYGWPPLFSLSGWRALFATIGQDLYSAAGVMYAEPVPYDLTPGLLVAMIPIVMIVVAFATSATLYERSPVISVSVLGLTIGVLSTISFEDGVGPYFFMFLPCAAALLLATNSGDEDEEEPSNTPHSGLRPAGIVAGAVVVGTVLLLPSAPLSDTTVSPGAIDWTRIGTGGTSRLDVEADVGDYLTSGREAELMRITSPEPLLWRAGTLDYFDGVRWSDTTGFGEGDGEEIAPGIETRVVPQEVEVLDAETDRLFGSYKMVNVSEPDATQNSDASWSVGQPLRNGSEYGVLSEIPQPTEAELQGAGRRYPLELQRFLELPDDTPAEVGQTATIIQREYSPQTPYEKARAIERYLIQDGGFTYNLNADYRRADEAIEEFLGEGKEGFCTQFATAMALIARDMDVPSRVVYGSTPGRKVGENEYIVTGANMHTWVEVYFPGVGWYPFDPTPGFSIPAAMEANAPRPVLSQENPTNENQSLQEQQAERQQDEQKQQEQQQQDQAPQASNGTREDGLPLWPLFGVAVLVLLAVPPVTKRALLARGHPEDLYRDLTGRLRDLLPPGRSSLADAQSLTPTERVMLLAGAVGVEEERFREFARAYSDHLYSQRRGSGTGRAYRRAIGALGELPRWRRVLGEINPSSLLARVAGGLSEAWTGLRKRLRGLLGRSRRS